jgi:hypothetical protein
MSYVLVTQESTTDGYEKAVTSEYEDLVELLRFVENILFEEAKSQATYASDLDSDYTVYVYHDDKDKLLQVRAEVEVLRVEAEDIFRAEKIYRKEKQEQALKEQRLQRIESLKAELKKLESQD